MKPPPFKYSAPRSLEEALSILSEEGMSAKVLAGGQSLIPTMNFRLAQPKHLVDLNHIAELDYVRVGDDGSVHIGSMTRQRTLEYDEQIKEYVPLLHETIPYIAHPQIRNRGTIGGSLVHADPAAELPLVAVALDATLVVANQDASREVKAEDFFFGMFMVDLMPGDVLIEIIIPPKKTNTGYVFTEVARRHGDYAMMGMIAIVEVDDNNICSSANLVYLNAGDKPTKANEASGMLAGSEFSDDFLAEVATKASQEEIEPYGNIHASVEYQRHLARMLTIKTLKTAYDRAIAL